MTIPIGMLLGKGTQGAKYGIEFEVEGRNLPKRVSGFRVVDEGSLRAVDGEVGLEYVTPIPLEKEKLFSYIDVLNAEFIAHEADPYFSHRTSVHVHVNVADLTVTQWFNFLFLWVLFEEAMVHYCGDKRKGNLFCLSSSDAEGFMFILSQIARRGDFHVMDLNNNARYAALNIAATVQYGSLEFRCMRGTMDMDVLVPWINTIDRLRELAIDYEKPSAILDELFVDVEMFVKKVFPDEHHFVYDFPDLFRQVLENGFRAALVEDDLNEEVFQFRDEPVDDI